jgi:aarF domain-containing kinase
LIAKIPYLERFEFPATVDEFKKVLYEQTNLVKESNNLLKFTHTFRKFDDQVVFPKVNQNYVSESVLVESFINAKPISHYMENEHEMNPVIAKVGMNVLYRMIFYENFVHSDCHAGNILVQINKGKKTEKSYFQKFEDFVVFDMVPMMMNVYYGQPKG